MPRAGPGFSWVPQVGRELNYDQALSQSAPSLPVYTGSWSKEERILLSIAAPSATVLCKGTRLGLVQSTVNVVTLISL